MSFEDIQFVQIVLGCNVAVALLEAAREFMGKKIARGFLSLLFAVSNAFAMTLIG